MNHTEFREWLKWNATSSEQNDKDHPDYAQPLRTIALKKINEEYNKLPDVEEAIKASVRLATANLAAEVEKILSQDNGTLLTSVRLLREIKTKLKELSK